VEEHGLQVFVIVYRSTCETLTFGELAVARFVEWLRKYNADKPLEERAGVYGLDLYSLDSSIQAVLQYLDRVDPNLAATARKRYGCLAPYVHQPSRYGALALSRGFAPCQKDVVANLRDLLQKRIELMNAAKDGEAYIDAEQNARLVADAETYYRAMFFGRDESWNLRDTHMVNTLERVLASRGADSHAVVWAHNSHLGDARATGMGARRGQVNVGQLCRERWESDVYLLGQGTHTGTVAAADEWDEPMQVMKVVPSLPGSHERLAHDSGAGPRFLLDLREGGGKEKEELRNELLEPRIQRFIGVIYRPDTERWSHYEDSVLPYQYDGYVFFDTTKAVTPLSKTGPTAPTEMEETYPFGL
jgi:erythromycin esterase-like protein